jgi:integrase/recombinase XerD
MFMMFLWVTGCRVSEMLGVKIQHCELEGDRVRVGVLENGKKERFVWLPSVLYGLIREGSTWLLATRTGRPYSRSYVSNQIAKLGLHILNRRISAHTFRHSFCTRKIRETGKIQAVSEYVGHSSVAITLSLYCHDELSAEDLSSETDLIGIVAA